MISAGHGNIKILPEWMPLVRRLISWGDMLTLKIAKTNKLLKNLLFPFMSITGVFE